MGLPALDPQPRTTIAAQDHKIYPDVLRGRAITRPHQVGSSDITYLPSAYGFM